MPQDGATLILQVRSLDAGLGWTLTGPGIEHSHRLRADGLDADFLTAGVSTGGASRAAST
jgi:alpha-D-ribose 1-methylphosphonate 5-triphosphate synthase subunit PhnH